MVIFFLHFVTALVAYYQMQLTLFLPGLFLKRDRGRLGVS